LGDKLIERAERRSGLCQRPAPSKFSRQFILIGPLTPVCPYSKFRYHPPCSLENFPVRVTSKIPLRGVIVKCVDQPMGATRSCLNDVPTPTALVEPRAPSPRRQPAHAGGWHSAPSEAADNVLSLARAPPIIVRRWPELRASNFFTNRARAPLMPRFTNATIR
jgi:hypothetical protein